ncbi:MAG: glycoside hydrolase family 3 C-terminal domain-containing protein [Clostridia bacterium]|nr:glycoside hydrolase family 3 C-terminal domain-containing protein [Clostridia bacterium]
MPTPKNIAFDTSRSFEERIEWLLANLTIEEKLGWLASRMPGCERLGIAPFSLGGEAAHGVEGRNDQNGLGQPDVTTSFPQPIGMSASWDADLLRACGEVVGTEARVVNKRHPGRGLSRWAPTVDLERDPRWGRNEEGYGEDPVLTGRMAGAYLKGMQGDDPKYIRTAATLKHFYANNTEEGRIWKNATVDPRNQYELYLEPFRRCIEQAGALGVMTAYIRINGKVGILNDEVNTILKEQYGLTHAVGDGGALNLVVTGQHYYGNHAESVAHAIKAGVDGMSDQADMVEKAAKEAYEQGLLTEQDMDRAIAAKLRVAMQLGHFDGDECPFDHVTEADICSAHAAEVSLKAAEKSLVLMKNDGLLPLDGKDSVALIGPMADSWYQDWYSGQPPYRRTIKDGMEGLNLNPIYADGWNRVRLVFGNQAACVAEDGSVALSDDGDVFTMECWGEDCYAFRCERTGKYLTIRMPEGPAGNHQPIGADREETFNWFVTEVFHLEHKADSTLLLNRFHWPVQVVDGVLVSGRIYEGTPVTIEMAEDGIAKATAMARNAQVVVLALGSHSLIPAKEEIDRHTLALPEHQQQLMEAVFKANPKTALVLVANYPYTISYAKEHIPAILLSASGSQDMGTAVANALYGRLSPAGRLNMTWYASDDDLPDMDDYDIIRKGRTYRYFAKEVLYPFGHGLSYTTFVYSNLQVQSDDQLLHFTLDVQNTGSVVSDEVVQLYGIAPASRVQKPLRQLLDFVRIADVRPGEKRSVRFDVPVQELRYYDVISRRLVVEAGEYRFFAGPSSAVEAQCVSCYVPGEQTGKRDLTVITPADHYDDCEQIAILQGTMGYSSITPAVGAKQAEAVYRDCAFDEDHCVLSLRVMSHTGGSVTVKVNGETIGSWQGDTRTCEHRSSPPLDRYAYQMVEARARERSPIWEDIDFLLPEGVTEGSLALLMTGDVQISFLRTIQPPEGRKISIGIAN